MYPCHFFLRTSTCVDSHASPCPRNQPDPAGLMLSPHTTCISTGDCPRACPGLPVAQWTSPFHFQNVLQPQNLKTTIYSSNFKCSCCCDLFFVWLFNSSTKARQTMCLLLKRFKTQFHNMSVTEFVPEALAKGHHT